MSRIGATLSGFERTLLNRLAEADAAVTLNNLRLATGRKINRPADSPSGFVEIDRLGSRLSGVGAALTNVTRASGVVSTAQLALDGIRTQLQLIRTKAVEDEDQALSPTDRAANQATIDAAIVEINRLAGSTFGAGKSLLDGSSNFQITGRNAAQVIDFSASSLGVGATETVDINVTTAGTRAALTYTGSGGQTTAAAQITVTGNTGSAAIAIADTENLTDVRDRINLESQKTGVTASVSGDTLTLNSVGFGTQTTASVQVTSGTFAVTGADPDGIARGTDAVATINGQSETAAGNTFTVNDNSFTFKLEIADGFTGAANTITVSGGGSLSFALGEDSSVLSTLAIQGVQAYQLGGLSGTLDQLATGGSIAGLNTNSPLAIRVVDEALADLTLVEGRVDGFANAAIASSSALLTGLQTSIQTSIDQVDKVDDQEELLLLSKNQALASNATTALTVLSQQRQSILDLVRQIAGLI